MSTRDNSNKKGSAVLKEKKSVKSFEVIIDYPRDGEAVMPGHYAIRVSAAPEANVEVSLNGRAWLPCRSDAGYYWCDWWAASGEVTLAARSKAADDEWKKSKERRVVVNGPEQN